MLRRRAGLSDGKRQYLLFKIITLVILLTTIAVPGAWAADAPGNTPANLATRIEALEAELKELKAQLAELRAAQPTSPAASMAVAPPPGSGVAAAGQTQPGEAALAKPPLSWFGYGELIYTRPTRYPSRAQADLARFVLGAGYRFDEHTRLQSELEIEHAVSSSADPGEVEIEQAYIEHELGGVWRARAGLFLVPSGLLNENHEPTRYYGVFRNFVETAIIPTTWREGGLELEANTAGGWRWDLGASTGFDLSKWDGASSEGADSPLHAIHQELALAHAGDISGFLAANFTGINGLRLGASLFGGGASQGQQGLNASTVVLWEGHLRWQPGRWDLAALYARGHISGTAGINSALTAGATLVPEDFQGWFVQGAWRTAVSSSRPLTPFLRYERFNTGSGYAVLGNGTRPPARAERRAVTGGVQLEFAPGVVAKADYVDFSDGGDSNRLDLGLGYEF
jgi:hypothetical protein